MPLITTIDNDLKNALKSGDQLKVSVLRLVKTALTNLEKQTGLPAQAGKPVTDKDAIAAINREIKQRQDTIAQLEASRPEMVKDDKKAIAILKAYLPEQMSAEQLTAIIDQIITATGAHTPQDMGKVIGAVMGQVKGKADGATVANIVRQKLSS